MSRNPFLRKEIYRAVRKRKGESIIRIVVAYDNGKIFQHFGHTEEFKIYDVENGGIISSEAVSTNGIRHGVLAGILVARKAEILICGRIGCGAQAALASAGIKLYGGVPGDAAAAAEALAAGTLDYDPYVRCGHYKNCHGCKHRLYREQRCGK